MSKALILKVLSGSQLGVEIGLPDGEYSFGSGPEADIQFSDLSMGPVHGQLRLQGGKVEIRATGAALQTASGLVIAAGDGEWREIAQLDRITAGTSVFAVGGADANWTSLANTPAPMAERRVESAQPMQVNRNWLIGGGVIAACLLLVLVLTGGGGSSPDAERLTGTQTQKLVRTALADLPFANDLDVVAEADGTITVSGYVETGTERRAVQNVLQEIGIDVRRRIWALEALRTDVAGLISSQNLDIATSLEPDGELILSGVSLDQAAVDHTVELLETEVFGLSKITNNVETSEDFLEETKALITKVQLGDLVLARLDGMLIETTGVVPRDKMDNWVGFMRTYARQIAPHLPLRSFVTLEGQAGDTTVPVIVGAREDEVVAGRVLPAETVETETTDPTSLFAGPEETVAPAPVLSGETTGTEAGVSAETSPETSAEFEAYAAMINDFAAQNPEIVAMLIKSMTEGRFSDMNGLRAFFASQGGGEAGALPAAALPGAEVSDPEALVRLLNGDTGDGAATDAPASDVAAASSFDVDAAVDRLNAGLKSLFDTTGTAPQLSETAALENPELAAVSKEMIDLASAQSDAMARGETLLVPLAPLEAQADVLTTEGGCWPGSQITVKSLPAVLLWMDILSISSNVDIDKLKPDSRVLFMEAALNPDRIRTCVDALGGEYGDLLLQNSAFLRETARNDAFAAFLFRNTPSYPLDLSGINLSGQRYAQLADGRKLGEGAAPAVDSRVVVIGDLGLLIRVSDGYRVNLYGDRIRWLVSGL